MQIRKTNNSFTVSDFKIVFKHNHETYERNEEDSGRTYNVGELKIPSVTTILSSTQSKEKQESLQRWRDRVGEKEAARITSQAATRGTEMHYVLEQYLKGHGYLNLTDKGVLARNMAHTIIENMSNFSEVWGTEVSVRYKNLYAGTTDAVGVFDNLLTIIDFKQSNKPKRHEWIDDYYLQIGAYSLAYTECFEKIKQGLILVCTKDLVFQKFSVDEAMLKKYQDKWLQKVDQYYKNLSASSPSV